MQPKPRRDRTPTWSKMAQSFHLVGDASAWPRSVRRGVEAMIVPAACVALTVGAAGCGGAKTGSEAATTTAREAAPPQASGLERKHFDPAVRPQDDLYRAITGQWLANTPIPADKSNYGAFTELSDTAEAQLRAIVETAAADTAAAEGSEAQKVGAFYAAWMDEATLETRGAEPLKPAYLAIEALKDKVELPALMATLDRQGVHMPLIPFVNQDDRDSTTMIGNFEQGGLGLPERDFYLQKDEKFTKLRAAYQEHIVKMLTLVGDAKAKEHAAQILALETRLAQAHWDKVRNRDPVATYNKIEAANWTALAKGFDFAAFNKAIGFGELPAVLVRQPSYVAALGEAVQQTPLPVWKTYLRWHVLHARAPLLSKAFVDEDFDFFGKTLDGIPEQRPRWKRAIASIDRSIGEAIGKIYVEKHFPASHKARMVALVDNLLRAYKDELQTLDWMGPETRKAALAKLATFRVKIGYPDVWRDYTKLAVKRDDLVGNMQRAAEFQSARELAKLGKPVDRTEWYMTPQTVNAYYDPQKNEIVFPAAILQPPFFQADADDAVNYGGIGAVIGHEISHGFDDQGSQYDGDGNLRSWWTDQDRKNFEERAAALAAQYGTYEPVAGYKLDGKFTLGENIADLGGLTMAYKAWVLSLGGKPAQVIDGLTGAQRLFAGWAQVWRRNYRQENLLNRIKTDPHSPSEFRANGTPVNVPAFHEAFGTKPGDKMYRAAADQVRIW